MKKMTAVEYLEQQIKEWGLVIDTINLQSAIQMAKNFEKLQMAEAWNALDEEYNRLSVNSSYKKKKFHEYYNEKYLQRD